MINMVNPLVRRRPAPDGGERPVDEDELAID